MKPLRFQSTPPVRGATRDVEVDIPATQSISIHAPREGGDRFVIRGLVGNPISIHAPREGGDGTHNSPHI